MGELSAKFIGHVNIQRIEPISVLGVFTLVYVKAGILENNGRGAQPYVVEAG